MGQMIMTESIKNQIEKLYLDGKSGSQILELLPVSFKTTKTIYDVLRKRNILFRKKEDYHYSRRSDFFEKISTKEQAYLLGLLITDGWITSDPDTSIGFSSVDKELTDLFPSHLETEDLRGITFVPGGQSVLMPTGNISVKKDSWQFQIKDRKLKSDLINLGFLPQKTGNELFPYIESHLVSHCLRGILDGDGTIYKISGVEQVGIKFYSGSSFFLRQISQLIRTFGLADLAQVKPVSTIFYIEYSRLDFVTMLGNFIYQDSERLRLNRKYNLYKGTQE